MTFFHQFLEMMAKERRATRATLSAYDADLRNFYEFLKGQKAERITLQDIQHYFITQSHLSPATLARRLSSLRQFYTYLVHRGVTKENPLSLVKVPHFKPKSISSLGTVDVKYLLEEAKTWNDPKGKRLSVLLHILHVSHMQIKGIVSLPLNSNLPILTRHPKPSSRALNEDITIQKTIEKANEALQDYLKVRHHFLAHEQESPWLFPSYSQKGHLTPQRCGQLLKELAAKIGGDPAFINRLK